MIVELLLKKTFIAIYSIEHSHPKRRSSYVCKQDGIKKEDKSADMHFDIFGGNSNFAVYMRRDRHCNDSRFTSLDSRKEQRFQFLSCEKYITQDTNDITSVADLKRMWGSRLQTTYEIVINEFNSDRYPNIDLSVNEDIWTSIYTKVVKNQDHRNRTITSADRHMTTSTLFRQANDEYKDNLLSESSRNKKQKLNELFDDEVPGIIPDTNVFNEEFRTEVFKVGYNGAAVQNLKVSFYQNLNLGEQQQIKNVRTNSAILKQLLKLPIDADKMSNCYVLAMNWIGVCGYLLR